MLMLCYDDVDDDDVLYGTQTDAIDANWPRTRLTQTMTQSTFERKKER